MQIDVEREMGSMEAYAEATEAGQSGRTASCDGAVRYVEFRISTFNHLAVSEEVTDLKKYLEML